MTELLTALRDSMLRQIEMDKEILARAYRCLDKINLGRKIERERDEKKK